MNKIYPNEREGREKRIYKLNYLECNWELMKEGNEVFNTTELFLQLLIS